MALYDDPHLALSAPDGWEERTFITFTQPGARNPATLVVTYMAMPETTLRAHVVELVQQVRKALRPVRVHELEDVRVGGREAVRATIEWRSEHEEIMTQTFVAVSPDAADARRRMTVLTFTTSATSFRHGEVLDAILTSVRFVDPARSRRHSEVAPRPADPDDARYFDALPMPGVPRR